MNVFQYSKHVLKNPFRIILGQVSCGNMKGELNKGKGPCCQIVDYIYKNYFHKHQVVSEFWLLAQSKSVELLTFDKIDKKDRHKYFPFDWVPHEMVIKETKKLKRTITTKFEPSKKRRKLNGKSKK